MGLFSWIVVGLIAGWLTGSVFGLADEITSFNLTTIVEAFFGAIIVLFFQSLIRKHVVLLVHGGWRLLL
jgi:uncharacterized membrane protein YeaQ/YmgE (transglycosylase-associated protein family)